jgi:hypothetical protein
LVNDLGDASFGVLPAFCDTIRMRIALFKSGNPGEFSRSPQDIRRASEGDPVEQGFAAFIELS